MCTRRKALFFIFSFVIFSQILGAGIVEGLGQLSNQLTQLSGKVGKMPFILWPDWYQQGLNNKNLRYAFAPILCAAVGDALGRVTEKALSLERLRKEFVSKESLTVQWLYEESKKSGQGWFAPGKLVRYSDDTVMAILVLEVALDGRDGGWSQQKMLEVMATNFIPFVMKPSVARNEGIVPSGPDDLYKVRYHGGVNQQAMERIYFRWLNKGIVPAGQKWYDNLDEQKEIGSEGGCGSVMRAWPLALVFGNRTSADKIDGKDVFSAELLALKQSRITHRHPMAQAACAALVRAMRLILNRTGSVRAIVDGTVEAAGTWRRQAKKQLEVMGVKGDKILREHDQKFKANLETSAGRGAARKALSANELSLEDMLKYAAAAAYGGDSPTTVFGEENDKADAATARRSRRGHLLGWAADEALAAAVYVFIRWADEDQLKKRKAEFKKAHLAWDDNSVIWYALQEAAWTPGDSDSIATLAGALLGAYHSLKVPGSEKLALVKHFESFDKLFNDAQRLIGKGTKPTGKLPENPGQLKKTTEAADLERPSWVTDADWDSYNRIWGQPA